MEVFVAFVAALGLPLWLLIEELWRRRSPRRSGSVPLE
jgi:hypothetical protein